MRKFPTFKKYVEGLAIPTFVIMLLYSCSGNDGNEAATVPQATENKGIDALMSDLGKLKEDEVFKSASGLGESLDKLDEAKAVMEKSQKELKAELVLEVTQQDRDDYAHELETIFNVGEEKPFFLRQVSYCRIKLDLAVVGIGILRVHEILEQGNPTVQKKDEGEYIKFVRDQVQDAVASSDKNYKTVVFKGLESSVD